MSAEQPVVTDKPPPPAFIKVANPVMKSLLRTGIGKQMKPLAILGITGRKSGKQHEIPVGAFDNDGALAIFTDRPWRLNAKGGADVTLTQGGVERRGHAELIDDPAVVGPAMAAAYAQVGARRLGVAVKKGATPTAQDFAAVGRSMIRITLVDDAT